jgi:hypothetical protein
LFLISRRYEVLATITYIMLKIDVMGDNFVPICTQILVAERCTALKMDHYSYYSVPIEDKSDKDRSLCGMLFSSEGTGLNFVKRHENVLSVQSCTAFQLNLNQDVSEAER